MNVIQKITLLALLCTSNQLYCLDLVKIANSAKPHEIIQIDPSSFYFEVQGQIIITINNNGKKISGRYIDCKSKTGAALPEDQKQAIFTALAKKCQQPALTKSN